MLETLLLEKQTFLLPGSRGKLLPMWTTLETLFYNSFIVFIHLSKYTEQQFIFLFWLLYLFYRYAEYLYQQPKVKVGRFALTKIGFNSKYEDGNKSQEQAPTSPLLCCVISLLWAYGQMGKKRWGLATEASRCKYPNQTHGCFGRNETFGRQFISSH